MMQEALLCLALNVFHESRSEPIDGQLAVALATRNRAEQHGTSICWEVFRDGQFSWTNDANNLRTLPAADDAAWIESQNVAREVLDGAPDFTGGATYFHVVGLHWRYARFMHKTGKWGHHIFYKKRGYDETAAHDNSATSSATPHPSSQAGLERQY